MAPDCRNTISARPAIDLREQARAWLEENWSGDRKADFDAKPFAKREFDPEFARDIGKTGWIGLGWSKEFGGQARSPIEQIAFMETMERDEAPRIGAAIQANALMMFGTPEQQRKYLPEILRGEAMHGMGYSEPEAGSDLAALRTSAVRAGDGWMINGQKIWTTTWWGKYMFLAARTDPEAKPAARRHQHVHRPDGGAGHHDPAGGHDVRRHPLPTSSTTMFAFPWRTWSAS